MFCLFTAGQDAHRGGCRAPRHRPPALLGDVQQPHLTIEEYEALSGVWRTDLELDDGDATISLHLATPKSLGAGKVHTMLKLPFNILPAGGRQSASWSIHPTAQDDQLGISLQLGTLQLEGRGERRGLRCSAFAGTVFEGGDDPCAVGNFAMQLALPIQSDLGPLEQRYHERIASRPAPPIAYTRAGFVGRWRLLISVDEHAPNARFPIELSDRVVRWQCPSSAPAPPQARLPGGCLAALGSSTPQGEGLLPICLSLSCASGARAGRLPRRRFLKPSYD